MNAIVLFMKEKISWYRHFIDFIKDSKDFLECSYLQIILRGGLKKAYSTANFMVKWDTMTPEQREHWYVNEDRVIYFDTDK